MSYTQDKSQSHSLRERARQRYARADRLGNSGPAVDGPPSGRAPADPIASMLERVASYWWVELLLGLFWVVIAVVVLKFDQASVTTVGILTGLMFLLFAAQEFVLAAVDRHRDGCGRSSACCWRHPGSWR